MRTAILFGLVFIGDNLGCVLGSHIKGDPTATFAIVLLFCAALDVADLFVRTKRHTS